MHHISSMEYAVLYYSKCTLRVFCHEIRAISIQTAIFIIMELVKLYTSLFRRTHGGLLLTHWGRVTHICVSKLSIIGSDNGLSPGRRQAIIWTSAGILLIGSLGTNFSEILIGIQTFTFKKNAVKMSSAKWRPFCLGLNVLTWINFDSHRIINSICWL